jgi:hypothetical protein
MGLGGNCTVHNTAAAKLSESADSTSEPMVLV